MTAGPLHFLAGNCSFHAFSAARILLASGEVDPNEQNEDGVTPVHVCSAWGNYETLKLLLSCGGNPFLKDSDGQDAFALAAQYNHTSCTQLLEAGKGSYDLNHQIAQTHFTPQNSFRVSQSYNPFNNNQSHCQKNPQTNMILADDDFLSEDLSMIQPSNVSQKSRFSQYLYKRQTGDENDAAKKNFKKSRTKRTDIFTCCYRPATQTSPVRQPQREAHAVPKAPAPTYQSPQRRMFSPNAALLCKQLRQLTISKATDGNSAPKLQTTISTMEDSIASIEEEEEKVLAKHLISKCEKLSDAQLRREIEKRGVDVGPINDNTRWLYTRRLAGLLEEQQEPQTSETKKTTVRRKRYTKELEEMIETGECKDSVLNLEQEMISYFEREPKKGQLWREGNLKMSFCYLLIDPTTLISDIPLSPDQHLRRFVDGIFYVGKGQKSRPHQHLKDAIAVRDKDHSQTKPSEKIAKILQLWKHKTGVVSLHVFHNILPVEAYTREAALIQAIGIWNLTNLRRGDYYGCTNSWTDEKKKQFGALLLRRAYAIFLQEGERRLFPHHLS